MARSVESLSSSPADRDWFPTDQGFWLQSRDWVCVLCIPSCVVSGGGSDILLTTDSGRPFLGYRSSVVIHNLFPYVHLTHWHLDVSPTLEEDKYYTEKERKKKRKKEESKNVRLVNSRLYLGLSIKYKLINNVLNKKDQVLKNMQKKLSTVFWWPSSVCSAQGQVFHFNQIQTPKLQFCPKTGFPQ